MKSRWFVLSLVFACALSLPNFAADKTEDKGVESKEEKATAKSDLQALVKKVQAAIKEGKTSEEDLAPFFKEFDALLAKYKGDKSEDVAQMLLMKGMLYAQILEDSDKAKPIIEQLKKDFPETRQGKQADQILEQMEKQAATQKLKKSLAKGTPFPDFEETDLEGKPLSVAGYKGKVVLVDFWATWCGPCIRELPNVLSAYEKYHNKGFDIIGISLDNKKEALTKFIEEKKMPWRQYFDGKGWGSKLAQKYGVDSIPATYLLDKEGKIIAKDLRGDALEKAVAQALGVQEAASSK